MCFFGHPRFENIEIYCVNWWVEVKQQGPPEHFFPEEGNYSSPNPVQKLHHRRSREGPTPGEREIDKIAFCSQDRVEDISRLFQEGYDVDNGKNCLNENYSRHRREDADDSGQIWFWGAIYHRSRVDVTKNRALLNGFSRKTLFTASIVQLFFMCFPWSYSETVIIELKNDRLDEPLNLRHIIRWIGIWFLLATVAGNSWKGLWSSRSVLRMKGTPFRVNDFYEPCTVQKNHHWFDIYSWVASPICGKFMVGEKDD